MFLKINEPRNILFLLACFRRLNRNNLSCVYVFSLPKDHVVGLMLDELSHMLCRVFGYTPLYPKLKNSVFPTGPKGTTPLAGAGHLI